MLGKEGGQILKKLLKGGEIRRLENEDVVQCTVGISNRIRELFLAGSIKRVFCVNKATNHTIEILSVYIALDCA